MALFLENGGDGGRIDAAGHGDGDQAALRFFAGGERIELGCGGHG